MSRRHSWEGDTCRFCGLRRVRGEPGHVAYTHPDDPPGADFSEVAGDCPGASKPAGPRPCAAGFTPVDDRMVRCDYCDRLVRRTGISGHKQHCGGWRAQYAPSEPARNPGGVTCRACGQTWPRDPALEVPCPQCQAPVGSHCRRPSGHGCELHASRDRAAMDAGILKPCPGRPA